ncbi:hypothetical protein ACKKBG_A04440 [Auxenochlorella protothecoides x Auxenochlorella symbiontica]
MTPSAVESFSLWLMPHDGAPEHPFNERLQREINAQANRIAGAPSFAPHVTLLGGIEGTEADVLERADRLGAQLKPYVIKFDKVKAGTSFFQCVFIKCQETPAVMQAAQEARSSYGKDPNEVYMPHLSLLYADITQEQREAVAQETQARIFPGLLDSIFLQKGDPGVGTGFLADSMSLWRTPTEDKSLNNWELVATIPLTG